MSVRSVVGRVLVIPVGGIALAIAAIPMPNRTIRLGWIVAVVAVAGWLGVRVWRMGVLADPTGLHVRNLDRDQHVRWSEVRELTVEAIEQLDGPVTYVVLHRTDGSRLVLGGTSTFRRSVAESWRTRLRSASPKLG